MSECKVSQIGINSDVIVPDHIRPDNVRSLLGEQICKALGVDASRITRIELVIEAGEMPYITLTRALYGNDCDGPLTQVLEQYQVTPIGSTPLADCQ